MSSSLRTFRGFLGYVLGRESCHRDVASSIVTVLCREQMLLLISSVVVASKFANFCSVFDVKNGRDSHHRCFQFAEGSLAKRYWLVLSFLHCEFSRQIHVYCVRARCLTYFGRLWHVFSRSVYLRDRQCLIAALFVLHIFLLASEAYDDQFSGLFSLLSILLCCWSSVSCQANYN